MNAVVAVFFFFLIKPKRCKRRINKLKSVWFTRYSHPTLFHQIEFALLFIYHKCNYCSLLRFISTFGFLFVYSLGKVGNGEVIMSLAYSFCFALALLLLLLLLPYSDLLSSVTIAKTHSLSFHISWPSIGYNEPHYIYYSLLNLILFLSLR